MLNPSISYTFFYYSTLPSTITHPNQPILVEGIERIEHGGGLECTSAYLNETDILALLSEALSADVQTKLSDETGFVCADSAIEQESISSYFSRRSLF